MISFWASKRRGRIRSLIQRLWTTSARTSGEWTSVKSGVRRQKPLGKLKTHGWMQCETVGALRKLLLGRFWTLSQRMLHLLPKALLRRGSVLSSFSQSPRLTRLAVTSGHTIMGIGWRDLPVIFTHLEESRFFAMRSSREIWKLDLIG